MKEKKSGESRGGKEDRKEGCTCCCLSFYFLSLSLSFVRLCTSEFHSFSPLVSSVFTTRVIQQCNSERSNRLTDVVSAPLTSAHRVTLTQLIAVIIVARLFDHSLESNKVHLNKQHTPSSNSHLHSLFTLQVFFSSACLSSRPLALIDLRGV